ncbi:MAG: nitronate monooxygenase [Alphaproteobacteria bacterium]|nr:nitronate monooxygenase [Alphaproteobacteria bacterium]OJV12269.1 MAG: 2-nitropropane dioxygenase [Alphaproteobacteria bacterium 33-17]
MFSPNKIKPVIISGKEVLPIIEGGKGVAVSNGLTSGAFAAAGAVGTFSGVNADRYDADGNILPVVYKGKTRKERHEELVQMGIEGGVTQAQIAYDTAGGNGRIHMNVLWEMGGAERILQGVLDRTKGLINGITCGAGMPYRVAEIAEKYNVYYYPIVSSMRAFRALWKRSYHKLPNLLGGVVYEDPWLAGGHNGLSNSEDPKSPEDPFPRVAELRKFMNEVGLNNVPVIMAGGVWRISEWDKWLDNPEIGPVAFQFGTRPLLTQESPISESWKKRLLTLKPGDVFLNKFSPTGFYSSAVRNSFIEELDARSKRQAEFRSEAEPGFEYELPFGTRGRSIYIEAEDYPKVKEWMDAGFTEMMKTPDETVIFLEPSKAQEIHKDQVDCMGCLSFCRFSNWKDHDDFTTGKKADPRSFCIQKTLQEAVRSADIDHQLMFSGHNAYRFGTDPFYNNGFIPSVKQLVERIMQGE